MPYIHFTEEQKLRAANVDLEQFLLAQGEELVYRNREIRLRANHSVVIKGNEWFDFASRKGGGPISFVQTFYGLSYPEAVSCLLGGETGRAFEPAPPKKVEPPKPFELPPAHKNARQVFAYLVKRRNVSFDIVAAFVKAGLIYEDAEHHNAVFVGKDEHGVSCHAHKRSTNSTGKTFRINVEGGDIRCSFHWVGISNRLYVFEAPIDLLSYITLHPDNWQRHSYVACCGTSLQPVEWMLEQLPQVTKTILCHDNDKAGWETTLRATEQLSPRGVEAIRDAPTRKDWNEDLLEKRHQAQQQEEVVASCQAFGS